MLMHAGNLPEIKLGSREAAILQRRRWLKPKKLSSTSTGLIQSLPVGVWLVAAALAMAAPGSQYPALTIASILIVPFMASLLLFKGDSPILFACCMMQWMQATTPVFYCDFHGISLEHAFGFPNMKMATQLSLFGLLALSIGMRIGLGRWRTAAAAMESEVRQISMSRLTRLWWAAFFLGSIAGRLAWSAGGLSQVLYALGSVKWLVLYVMAYKVLAEQKGARPLIIAMALEFALGLLGFFGNFKEVIYIFGLAYLSLGKVQSLRTRCISLAVAVFGFFVAIYWQALKADYRGFQIEAAQGKGGSATTMEKVQELRRLYTSNTGGILSTGFANLVERVSYTQFFGSTLEYVPSRVPHEGGSLWIGAVKHVLMPRLLFPNKAITDDSSRANKYTGLNLAGIESETSIGIGYMAESYIDFGVYGMIAPIFLFGLLMGLIYRRFASQSRSRLWGTAMGTTIMFSLLGAFESSNMKIVGALILYSLAMWAINRAFGKNILIWLKVDAFGRRL